MLDGKECESLYSFECTRKADAVINGNFFCYKEDKCYKALVNCHGESNCREKRINVWFINAFMPSCVSSTNSECADSVQYFESTSAPGALKACLGDGLCRELLANFRRGDFSCRRYEPCLDALGAVLEDKKCDGWKWCADMKKIDALYTEKASTCHGSDMAACSTLIGVDKIASTEPRRMTCDDRDTLCWTAAQQTASDLISGTNVRPECFLWGACRDQFATHARNVCERSDVKQCAAASNILNFLTHTRPSCTYGYTASCKQDMEKIWK